MKGAEAGSTLATWAAAPFEHAGRTRTVYRRGSGHRVLLLHEVPGITPHMLDLADTLVERGFEVWLPHLFGRPGAPRTRYRQGLALAEILATCRFTCFRPNRTAPITPWLQGLVRSIAEGPTATAAGAPLGVVGTCIGGSVALGLAVEPSVRAVVVSEPCAPLALVGSERRDVNLAPPERSAISARASAGDLAVMGLRFGRDWFVPEARFATYREVLGPHFEALELDAVEGGHRFGRWEHLVLTADRRSFAARPACVEALNQARDRAIVFLDENLA